MSSPAKHLIAFVLAALLLAPAVVRAQTAGGFLANTPLSSSALNAAFAAKQDNLGTSGSGALARVTGPAFSGPILGAATGTSLALGGATIGANALAVTGTTDLGGTLVMSGGNIRINFGALQFGASTDLLLSRKAAATIQHGDADAAAPIAQTVTAQSVVAGTSNTAAPNFTFDMPKGTGTGTGGSFIVRGAPAGSTGTAQNAEVAALTIDSTKTATFGGPISVPGNITTTAGGNAFITGSVYSGASTVASLPSCSGQDGARRFVTDATVTTFASAVVGGGSNHVPVYCDGSGTPTWKIGG